MIVRSFQQAKRWFDPLAIGDYPLFCAAIAFAEEGDPGQAYFLYEEALRRDPQNTDVLLNIKMLAQTYRVPEAVAFYREHTAQIVKALPAYTASVPATGDRTSPIAMPVGIRCPADASTDRSARCPTKLPAGS